MFRNIIFLILVLTTLPAYAAPPWWSKYWQSAQDYLTSLFPKENKLSPAENELNAAREKLKSLEANPNSTSRQKEVTRTKIRLMEESMGIPPQERVDKKTLKAAQFILLKLPVNNMVQTTTGKNYELKRLTITEFDNGQPITKEDGKIFGTNYYLEISRSPRIGQYMRILKEGTYEDQLVRRAYVGDIIETDTGEIREPGEYFYEVGSKALNRKAYVISNGVGTWVDITKVYNDESAASTQIPVLKKGEYHVRKDESPVRGNPVLIVVNGQYRIANAAEVFQDGFLLTASGTLLSKEQYIAPMAESYLLGQTVYVPAGWFGKKEKTKIKMIFERGPILTESGGLVTKVKFVEGGPYQTCAEVLAKVRMGRF